MGTTVERDPCPDRILDDIGLSFGIGFIGGSAIHFIKGAYNSPKGARLAGAYQATRLNAPRIGGGFAAWAALFSAIDCTMVYARQKEDPWNSIASGAATGGLLSLRRGLGATARSTVFGGIFFVLMEGSMIMLNKMSQPQVPASVTEEEILATGYRGLRTTVTGGIGAPAVEDSGARSKGWFAGLFGGWKKEKEEEKGKGSETKVLQSFDAPPVPNFEFK